MEAGIPEAGLLFAGAGESYRGFNNVLAPSRLPSTFRGRSIFDLAERVRGPSALSRPAFDVRRVRESGTRHD